MTGNGGRWVIRRPQAQAAQLRLFCFPFAGSGASLFYSWADLLPPAVELAAVQLPGRENRLREPAYSRLEPLIEALVANLRPWFDMPFAILGYSYGALVGFELARALRRQGGPQPEQLLVISRRAPQLPSAGPEVHNLSETGLLQWMTELGGTPQELLDHPELLPIFLPILQADLAANERYCYRPEAPLILPITTFGGSKDTQAQPAELAGWRFQTAASFNSYLYPGGHFFFKEQKAKLLQDISWTLGHLPAGKPSSG
jgi:medium-chain acyl-[acyl-carrier-protein] hydrolase